jgi:hypothetical protein
MPVRAHVTVLIFNKFPAINKERAFIIETDKEKFRPPAETVSNVHGGCMTQGKFLFAVRAVVFFLKIGKCSF